MEYHVFGQEGTVTLSPEAEAKILSEAGKYRIHVFMHYYKEAFLYDTIWNFKTEKDEIVEPSDIVLSADKSEIYGIRRQADRMENGVRMERVDYLRPELAGNQEIRYDSKVYYDDFYEFNTYYIYSLVKV